MISAINDFDRKRIKVAYASMYLSNKKQLNESTISEDSSVKKIILTSDKANKLFNEIGAAIDSQRCNDANELSKDLVRTLSWITSANLDGFTPESIMITYPFNSPTGVKSTTIPLVSLVKDFCNGIRHSASTSDESVDEKFMDDNQISNEYSGWWISYIECTKGNGKGADDLTIQLEFPEADGEQFDTGSILWYRRMPGSDTASEMNDVWMPAEIKNDVDSIALKMLDQMNDRQTIEFNSKDEFEDWLNGLGNVEQSETTEQIAMRKGGKSIIETDDDDNVWKDTPSPEDIFAMDLGIVSGKDLLSKWKKRKFTKKSEPTEQIGEEVDVGWEIEARRDTNEQNRRMRNKKYAEPIVIAGKKYTRENAIRKLRVAIGKCDDRGCSDEEIAYVTNLIKTAQNCDAGDEIHFDNAPEKVKTILLSFFK